VHDRRHQEHLARPDDHVVEGRVLVSERAAYLALEPVDELSNMLVCECAELELSGH
jgi:hypothetical protein